MAHLAISTVHPGWTRTDYPSTPCKATTNPAQWEFVLPNNAGGSLRAGPSDQHKIRYEAIFSVSTAT